MFEYERLLICVALNEEDDGLVRYASLFGRLLPAKKASFVHVMKSLELPTSAMAEKLGAQLLTPTEVCFTELQDKVAKFHNERSEVDCDVDVLEGNPLVQLLHHTCEQSIDLVVIGSRGRGRSAGTLPERIARKAPCSVLIVPEQTSPSITKILVPIDFSQHSKEAMKAALTIAAGMKEKPSICGVHIYDIPTGYHKLGKTYEEFGSLMLANAQKAYEDFVGSIDLMGMDVEPVFELASKPAAAIVKVAEERGADLLVIGGRGRTNAAAALLGSVAERLINQASVPVLTVKEKGGTLTFLQAVLNRMGT